MEPFRALARGLVVGRPPRGIYGALLGAAGGLAGTLAGHWAVWLAHQLTGNANLWLRGAQGPPFFDLTLSTAVYYGCLGAAVAGGRARSRAAGLGFGVAFGAIALPLALGTRLFRWGAGAADAPTFAWFYLVLGAYIAANVVTAAALGALAAPTAGAARAKGAAKALGGLLAAYLLDRVVQRFLQPGLPNLAPAAGFLPPPPALATGLIWGLFIGAAVGGRHHDDDQTQRGGPAVGSTGVPPEGSRPAEPIGGGAGPAGGGSAP